MPYEPHAPSPKERNNQHVGILLGGAQAAAALVSHMFGANLLAGILGFMAANTGAVMLNWRFTDDYAKTLMADGARWAMTLAFIWLATLSMLVVFGGGMPGLESYDEAGHRFGIPLAIGDALTSLHVLQTTFYLGSTVSHFRA